MIRSATQYHEITSYHRDSLGGQGLDWKNQPFPFKTYPGAPLLLPRHEALPQGNLSSLLKLRPGGAKSRSGATLVMLSQVLRLAYSLTAKALYPDGDTYYRCVASAGALYPTEIYLAAREVEGLGSGLYHFSIARQALTVLRRGNYQEAIGGALIPSMKCMPKLTFFLSAIFFRSAWKYRERSYRYHLLDTGHVLENLLLALTCLKLPAQFTLDFSDESVNRLLGFDTTKEVCLAVSQGSEQRDNNDAIEDIEPLPEDYRRASIISQREIAYPAVAEIHAAGARTIGGGRPKAAVVHDLGPKSNSWKPLDQPEEWPEVLRYAEGVMQRRSRRNFIRESLSRPQADALLSSLCAADFENAVGLSEYSASLGMGFLAARLEGVEPGFHLLDHGEGATALVKPGDLMQAMAHICLDQMWLGNAALHFLFFSNLDALDRQYGARGYRYAMMMAGRLGERLYLVATTLGLGCCGIGAFYDHEAQKLLGLNQFSRLLYLVAVGPVKRERE